MNLEGLSYVEIQDIKKLCQSRQQELVHNIPYNYKGMSIEEINETYRLFKTDRNPFREKGRLGHVLDIIDSLEDKIKIELKKG